MTLKLFEILVYELKDGNYTKISKQLRTIVKETKITLKKGSNDVMVEIKYKGGGRGRRAGSSVYTGSLHPVDAVNLERGTLYR